MGAHLGVNKLIRVTQRELFTGAGKPEALKHALPGELVAQSVVDQERDKAGKKPEAAEAKCFGMTDWRSL